MRTMRHVPWTTRPILARSRPVVAVRAMRHLHEEERRLIRSAVEEAKRVCYEDEDDIGCIIAWDIVDEVVHGLDQRRAFSDNGQDPMEVYCGEFPENDECRTYET